MKLSYAWLQEHFSAQLPPANALSELITKHIAEVEGVEETAHRYANKMATTDLLGIDLGWKSTEPVPAASGQSLEGIVELADTLIDIDNKSLTHRPDLMGHVGFCRELGALLGIDWSWPPPNVSVLSGVAFPVSVHTNACNRFMAVEMSGVKVEGSALKTQARLEHLGIRSISNIVDITNHVLLGIGQPMHAFDADVIQGEIIVRNAQKGEELIALDGETYALEPTDMVIADAEKVLSIAGIMGGLASGVTKKTTRIVLECANFDATTIRKTSARLGLRSESSMRYEKSLAPEQCQQAILTAIELVLQSCRYAQMTSGITDIFQNKTPQTNILLRPEWLRQVTGLSVPDAEIEKKLMQLGFSVALSGSEFSVDVPWWRATKDIEIEADLVEEVVRMYGLDAIESSLPELQTYMPLQNSTRSFQHKARNVLSQSGWNEVMHYSFHEKTDAKNAVLVQNPLSENQIEMRTSLLKNMLADVESSLRTESKIQLFELGRTYIAPAQETEKIGLLVCSMSESPDDLFFTVKAGVERLGCISVKGVNESPNWAHPNKNGAIFNGEMAIGQIGVLHPALLPDGANGAYAEIEIQSLTATSSVTYIPVSPYPSVKRDISLLVQEKTPEGEIMNAIKQASAVIESVECLDRYADAAALGGDTKSLHMRIMYRSAEKTLKDADIEAENKAVEDILREKYNAEIR